MLLIVLVIFYSGAFFACAPGTKKYKNIFTLRTGRVKTAPQPVIISGNELHEFINADDHTLYVYPAIFELRSKNILDLNDDNYITNGNERFIVHVLLNSSGQKSEKVYIFENENKNLSFAVTSLPGGAEETLPVLKDIGRWIHKNISFTDISPKQPAN